MIDPVEAILVIRAAEEAAKAYIDHSLNCSDCKVDEKLDVVTLCGEGYSLQEEYIEADEAAWPYIQNWKQNTGQVVTIQ